MEDNTITYKYTDLYEESSRFFGAYPKGTCVRQYGCGSVQCEQSFHRDNSTYLRFYDRNGRLIQCFSKEETEDMYRLVGYISRNRKRFYPPWWKFTD